MKIQLMKDLGDMNPGELEPKAWNGGNVSVPSNIIKSLPEKECMKARIAVFEAIVDEVIDDTIEEKETETGDTPTDGEVEEVVEPVVDKAVALNIVPRSAYRVASNMIHAKIVSHKTRASLLAKAAHFVAEAVTDTDYNAGADDVDTPIDETVKIDGEIDDATSEKDETLATGTSPTTAKWAAIWNRTRMDADSDYNAGADNIDTPIDETVKIDGEIDDATSEKDETPAAGTSPSTAQWAAWWNSAAPAPKGGKLMPGGKPMPNKKGIAPNEGNGDAQAGTEGDDINVDVDSGFDAETKANMRALVTSAIRHRRATARVSQRLTAELTDDIMYQLRYALPAKFYSKYSR